MKRLATISMALVFGTLTLAAGSALAGGKGHSYVSYSSKITSHYKPVLPKKQKYPAQNFRAICSSRLGALLPEAIFHLGRRFPTAMGISFRRTRFSTQGSFRAIPRAASGKTVDAARPSSGKRRRQGGSQPAVDSRSTALIRGGAAISGLCVWPDSRAAVRRAVMTTRSMSLNRSNSIRVAPVVLRAGRDTGQTS